MNRQIKENYIDKLGLDSLNMIENNEMIIRRGPVDKESALLKSIKVIRDAYRKDRKKIVSVLMKDDKYGYIELLDSDNTVNVDYMSANALKDKIKEAIKDGIESYCIWLPVGEGRYEIVTQ